VFGPWIGPAQVRQAVQATLEKWAPTYVAEAARRVGVIDPPLVGFNEWENDADISPVGGDQAPRWTVYCPGTLDVPRRDGDGTYACLWDVQVNLWLWGTSWQDTEDRLGWYMTALMQALLQHPSLGGFAQSLYWRGVSYRPVDQNAFHTWGRGTLLLGAFVENILDAYAGPATVPTPDPTVEPPVPPTVEHTATSVEQL
jgi:hypothetical protein